MKSGLRGLASSVRNALRVRGEHLAPTLERGRAESLFRDFIEQIEVETTSFCNRVCSFCPNAFLDRRSRPSLMPEAAWQAILDGLREVDYRGTFVWSRYSEPISEEGLVARVRQVREAAPRCRIAINSNGDYLDGRKLDALREAGLDRLMVDLYLAEDEVDNTDSARICEERFLTRVGRTAKRVETEPELVARLDDPLEVVTHVRNARSLSAVYYSDRGGLMPQAGRPRRVSPCFIPYKQLTIDWDGSVVPCCQVRSDAAAHREAVVCRLGENGVGLVEAYVRLAGWRRGLSNFEPKSGPCAHCDYASLEATAATRLAWRTLSRPDGALRRLVGAAFRPLLGRREIW